MAWSSADISAADLAYAAADKPIIAGINALRSPVAVKWATTADGSDITLAANPTSRSYDDKTHLTTKPNAAGTEFWLHCELNASPDDFDGILIVNQSGLSGVGALLEVRISNNAAWSSGNETIASVTVTDDKRIAFLDLEDAGSSVAQRFSGVPYFYLRFTDASSFTPEIGEVWLIRRRQMPHFPRLPFDPNTYASEFVTNQTKSGVITSYASHTGRQDLSASFSPSASADITEIKSFMEDTSFGASPFAWIEKPNSAPEAFRLVQGEPGGLSFPLVGPFERQVTISGREVGPKFQSAE